MNKLTNITVAGGGVIGSQIALQASFKGKRVTIWSRRQSSLEKTKKRLENLHKKYHEQIDKMLTPEGKDPLIFSKGIYNDPTNYTKEIAEDLKKKVDEGYNNIRHELDLGESVKDADLLIEAIIEDKQIKTEFFQSVSKLLPDKTIEVTNSSTYIPSLFADASGRPDRFLALHFANSIWIHNTAEIMSQSKTNPENFEKVIEFAKDIGMVALPVIREKKGYILNSILCPWIHSSLNLWANGYSDFNTINETWKLATGHWEGPFEIIDVIGLETTLKVEAKYPGADDYSTENGMIVKRIKEMIDAGKLGKTHGEGFYKYDK